MASKSWRERAKCKGQDPLAWETSSIPGRDQRVKSLVAKGKCSGCPVVKDCGAEVLQNRTYGMIQAAQALDNAPDSRLINRLYNEIRTMLGIPEIIPRDENQEILRQLWPRECKTCGATMRPRENAPAEDWPGTVQAYTKSMCRDCYFKMLKQRAGNHDAREQEIRDRDAANGTG